MEIYMTKEGDTINSVAKEFGIRVVDLVDANNLGNIYYLEPNQELKIPTTIPVGFDYYIIKKGDTLYDISKKYNLTAQELANLNGLELNEYIYPDQKLLVPEEGIIVYITQEGDRLNNLAKKLDIMKEEILFYNPNIYLLPDQIITYREKKENA